MNVDAAVRRTIEDRLRQDQAVGGNDEHIERKAGELLPGALIVERAGLEHCQSSFARERLYRAGYELEPAPLRPVGPGHDYGDRKPGAQDRGQRRRRERRRASKPDSQSGGQGQNLSWNLGWKPSWNRAETESAREPLFFSQPR